ncbi:NAD(P)-dependent oxidoreductase [Nitratireductor aestuarii]|uniref:NAD(P)-dependent oxidoreductase n=1 Tax=Nitratireductor aestuarii TaxID=1735103 RepID=A0A916RG24_9HYPH|nr:SDR family oxidoreductase [Nitratireductor aestuarii]GGA53017.1 NAD(P)-dependent oxidoreductase [Nitratireductor aestuarii]
MGDNTPPPQHQDKQPGDEHKMHPEPDYAPRFPGSGRLDGKVAVITGGDSGIGRATAVLFAREGAKVAFLYKDEDKDARDTEELIRQEGSEAFSMAGDVGETSVAEKFISAVIERWGQIDVVVNNAAEQHYQEELTDISDEQLERTFRTNIFGIFAVTRAALPHLKKGSAIICTTSVTAYKGQQVLMDYASTKGAILAFVRALSGNLAEKGIRVNGVAPGPIWTPLIPASFPEEKVAKFGGDVPLGRPGQPNEVASCMLFLACEDSSYMTGQVLHPNGGTLVGG